MSYEAKVFRILIASPGDVIEERDLATQCIQEWNDLNSAERKVVLLPMRWETHSRPEYGRRPQEIINTTVVDQCDLLIGMFWTRLGTDTGVGRSGTIEEIERVAKAGRPVMLYFSKVKIDPERIDLAQLAKLNEFKKLTYPNALIDYYSDLIDFKDKLSRHLEMRARELMSGLVEGKEGAGEPSPTIADLKIELIDPETANPSGTHISLVGESVDMSDFDQIPDHEPPPEESPGRETFFVKYVGGSLERDVYRRAVFRIYQNRLFRPLQFNLENIGLIGIRDIHIDLSLRCDGPEFYLLPPSAMIDGQNIWRVTLSTTVSFETPAKSKAWSTSIEFPAIQPKRSLRSDVIGYVGSTEDTNVFVEATIYGDCFPEPRHKELTIALHPKRLGISAMALYRGIKQREEEEKMKTSSHEGQSPDTASPRLPA